MVEVRVKRRLGVRVRIRWDAGCWSVTTNLAGAKLPIARRTFASLQQLLKRASRIGAELDLTDDDLTQLWQAAEITATDGDLSRYVVPTPGVGDHATVGRRRDRTRCRRGSRAAPTSDRHAL